MLKKSVFILLIGIIITLSIKLGLVIENGLIFYVIIYIYYYFSKLKKQKNKLLKTMFFVYICSVLELTVFPMNLGSFELKKQSLYYSYGNLSPFIDLKLALTTNQRVFSVILKEIVLNGIMLIPFGIMYPLVSVKKATFIKTVLYGFLFSVAIETFQLFMTIFFSNGRIFDITDIITNTIGVITGYVIYVVLKKVFKNA